MGHPLRRLRQRLFGGTNVVIFALTSVGAFAGLLLIGFMAGDLPAPGAATPADSATKKTLAAPAHLASTGAARPKGVGTLIGSKDCEWGPSEVSTEQHSRLTPGKLKLTTGVAEIRLDQGAVLILEGPAVFEIRSKNSALLHQGKLVAHVPRRAKGFELRTPNAVITDLGLDAAEQADAHPPQRAPAGPSEGGTIRLGPGESKLFGPDQSI